MGEENLGVLAVVSILWLFMFCELFFYGKVWCRVVWGFSFVGLRSSSSIY